MSFLSQKKNGELSGQGFLKYYGFYLESCILNLTARYQNVTLNWL